MANVPTSIGRYQIVKSIGHGGMGSLYLAWDKDLERQLVIKVLRDDDDELRARFSREAKSAARLKHTHIVTIFELGEYESQPYIAMEYIEGPTLAEVISGHEQPSLPRKLELMAQLCDGLGYAHKAGVVHRDIKPANVMIHKDGDLKILDFGVARIAESASMTQAGMMIGTLNYMSPEQVSGESLDHRSDIFAVGTVFYELLALKKAFPGTISSGVLGKILSGVPEPLRDVCPGLNEDVIRIIGRAIEKNVESRYPDLESMRRELLAVHRRLEAQSDATQIIDMSGRSKSATPTSGSSRRSTARDDLDRRRASQVQYYLDLAERAMGESRYDSVIASCEQALLLDAENARAIELVDQARAESEGQQAQQLLADAERELARGALTLASDLVEQAAAMRASPEQVRLRQTIDAAIELREQSRRRVEAVKAAVERARAAFEVGAFAEAVRFADEALATDPSHAAAATLKVKAAENIARAAREAAEQHAREAILDARHRFAKGDHAGAIAMLESFSPPHDSVSRALAELVAESARIAAERKREAEARAKQQRIAGVLALSREEMRDQRFASALERLQTLERVEGATPEIAELIRQVRDAEAAERKAQEEAAKAAEQRRRDAAARARQQRIADGLALASQELRDRQFAKAIDRLSTLERVEGQTPEIAQLVQKVKAAEDAERKAAEAAERKAAEAAERKAAEAAERKAAEAAERKAAEAAERKAKEAAERKAAEAAERKAAEAAERKAKEAAERKAAEAAERKAKEEADRKEKKEKEEAERAAAERRREVEARASRQRIAGVVSLAREELRDQRFASALERLVALMRTEGPIPEVTKLVQEVQQAEDAHRKAQQEAAARQKAQQEAAARQKAQEEAAAREREQADAATRDLDKVGSTVLINRAEPPEIPLPPVRPEPEPRTELRVDRAVEARREPRPEPRPEPKVDPAARPGAQKPPRDQTRKAAIAAAVVLVVGVGGYLMFGRPPQPPPVGNATTTVATTSTPTTTPTTTTAPPSGGDEGAGRKPDLPRANSLAKAGLTLLGQGKLDQAEAKFHEAQAVAETPVATSGLGEVTRRRRDYRQRWQAGEREAKARNYQAALNSYRTAKDLDPESFARDGGEARLTEVSSQMSGSDKANAMAAEQERLRKLAEAARLESSRLFDEGRELAGRGRYDDADARYTSALQQNKDNSEAASAQNRSQQYKQAKAKGESNAQSNDSQVLRERAQALEDARKLDSARFAADGLNRTLDEVNRRLAPAPPAPPKPAPATDERSVILGRLQAFARAISSETNPAKDNGAARAIWPQAPNYFDPRAASQYQHFEFTSPEFETPARGGSTREVIRCNQVQRYGPDAKRTSTRTEKAEIVFEKRNGVWFIIALRFL